MPTREQTVLPRVSRTIEDVRASVFGYVETAQDSLATHGYLPVRLNLNKGVVRGLLEIFAGATGRSTACCNVCCSRSARRGNGGMARHARGERGPLRRAATKARGKCALPAPWRPARTQTSPSLPGASCAPCRTARAVFFRYSTVANRCPAGADRGCGSRGGGLRCGGQCVRRTDMRAGDPVTGIAGVSNPADWLVSEGPTKKRTPACNGAMPCNGKQTTAAPSSPTWPGHCPCRV